MLDSQNSFIQYADLQSGLVGGPLQSALSTHVVHGSHQIVNHSVHCHQTGDAQHCWECVHNNRLTAVWLSALFLIHLTYFLFPLYFSFLRFFSQVSFIPALSLLAKPILFPYAYTSTSTVRYLVLWSMGQMIPPTSHNILQFSLLKFLFPS